MIIRRKKLEILIPLRIKTKLIGGKHENKGLIKKMHVLIGNVEREQRVGIFFNLDKKLNWTVFLVHLN